MEKIKKLLLFSIPVSICNFRCHYCYLGQREESFRGEHPEMKYSPEHFGKAMIVERVGGWHTGIFAPTVRPCWSSVSTSM